MIRCEALDEFSLSRFRELKNIERAKADKNETGWLYKGDKFECKQDLADYLNGANDYKKSFVRILEVIPIQEERKTKQTKKSKK